MPRKPFLVLVLCWLALALVVPALAETPYAHTNSKGRTYYLFQKDVELKGSGRLQTIYFFAKNPEHDSGEPVAELPPERVVSETKTGMLVLKKKPAESGS